MRFTVKQAALSGPYQSLLRQAGYSYQANRQGGQDSFSKTFGRSPYPRFHIYVEEIGDKVSFNLHLDQKRPSYGSTAAHSGEYDSELIKQEVERLKSFLH